MSEALQRTVLPDERIVEANRIARAEFKVSSPFTEKIVAILVKRLQDKKKLEYEEISLAEITTGYMKSGQTYSAVKALEKKIAGDGVIVDTRETLEFYNLFSGKIVYSKKNNTLRVALNSNLETFYLNLARNFSVFSLTELLELQKHSAQRLYHILKSYEYLEEFVIDIDELKRITNSTNYKNYSDFEKRVLIPAQDEIFRKTTMRFYYETASKERKKIKSIRFIFKHVKQLKASIKNV